MEIKLFKYVYTFPNGLQSETWLNPQHLEAITKKGSCFVAHMQSGKQFNLTFKDATNFMKMLNGKKKPISSKGNFNDESFNR